MRRITIILAAFFLMALRTLAAQEHHHELSAEEIGSVHFLTSCSQAAQPGFNRAVALLHSFQYEQARHAFNEVAALDPSCAMAQWGVAMSHYHGLWKNGDTGAGRLALRKAQQIAASNAATTSREKAYIDALAEVYAEDAKDTTAYDRGKDATAHDQAFEKKMGDLQAAYADDTEAVIFHALSLYIVAPNTDKTFANQRRCGEILEPIFKKQPYHPGVAHYIIHCYDNPVLAEKGLTAARMYAKIAPASAHANHMPSHLFTRVGSWDESVGSNRRSAQLAAAAEPASSNGEARDQRLHALDYLEYAYLQSGQIKQAKAVLAEMNALPPIAGLTLTGDYALAAIPARAAIELGNWEQASALKVREGAVPWAEAITWAAIGEGSARSGNQDRAAMAEQKLAALRDVASKQNNTYWSNQIEVQRREVAAWIAELAGKKNEAIAQMHSAAELEESMDKNAVTPGAVAPAREMLAELLLLGKKPQESLTAYEAVLKVAPNRFNALYGAARAAEAFGNETVAKQYIQKLSEISPGNERPKMPAKIASSSASR
ncbi:MAG: tetratricopeptide repeat protein [Candidatus Acidiferrum sp.]